MSYFGRLLAMARDDAPTAGATAAPAFGVVEQHEHVDAAAPPPPSSRSSPPALREDPPRIVPEEHSVREDRGARVPDPLPAVQKALERPADARAVERVAPTRPPVPVSTSVRAIEVVAEKPAIRDEAPPVPPRADEPAAPGMRVLREVMHWIARTPDPAREPDRVAQPTTVHTRDEVRVIEPREAPPAPVVIEDRVDVSIGAIEVTIEPSLAPPTSRVPAPRTTPRRSVTRDTRLARRLPRSG